MAIINGTNLNDNDTFQFDPFPILKFFGRLDGTNSDDSIFGFGGNDILNGLNGNDFLDGGTGVDAMNGGDGNDTYIVDNSSDTTTENFDDFLGGVDTVNSSVTWTLGFGFENLNLTGSSAINGFGNAKNNVINGNFAANYIDGGAGADTMNGGDGNDTYIVDNTGDVVAETFNDSLGGVDTVFSSVSFGPLGFGIENLTLTGTAAINGTGNSNNNVIKGNSAANVIDGGTGADTMNGGDGNDTYFVDNTGDVAAETFNDALGGVDTVFSSVSFGPLGFGIENLTLTGFAAINGTGNENSNVIKGNSAANVIDGGLGADTMNGGDGNDTYFVDNVGDVVAETFNDALGGVDTVNSSVTYGPLGFGIENLNLIGIAAINGTGNENNNVINGNSAANVIDGGLGADTMNGGDGSDTYFVDNVSDVVAELFNDALGGVDTVNSSVTFGPLGFGIENLNLTGTAAINGTGNANNNVIKGNFAANVIDGGLGADTMNGGDGSDTYFVDNVGDTVTENFNDALGGNDTVNSSVTWTLGFGLENLTLTGTAAINGTGNANNNVINGNVANNTLDGGIGDDTINGFNGNDTLIGGAGNDKLNGGAGSDLMTGGDGNDSYTVDNVGDVVVEALTGGTDIVFSSITYTLGANVENLTLGGAAAINGTGNTLNNVIKGNNAANTINGDLGNDNLVGNGGVDRLFGGNGNDILSGGTGNDILNGGSGFDRYLFNAPLASNVDSIVGFVAADDNIALDDAFFTSLTAPITAGNLKIGAGAVATDANDFLLYNTANGALSYDADGSGIGAAVQFATLVGVPAISAADFFVV